MIRVLVVDDHALVRSGLRLLLDADPEITVEDEAGSAEQAVRKARLDKPDVVLLDIIDRAWLVDVESVGVTSGASVPEALVHGVVAWFRVRGVKDVRAQAASPENVSFRLPAELR